MKEKIIVPPILRTYFTSKIRGWIAGAFIITFIILLCAGFIIKQNQDRENARTISSYDELLSVSEKDYVLLPSGLASTSFSSVTDPGTYGASRIGSGEREPLVCTLDGNQVIIYIFNESYSFNQSRDTGGRYYRIRPLGDTEKRQLADAIASAYRLADMPFIDPSLLGLDYSEEMLETARKLHQESQEEYRRQAAELESIPTKFALYEVKLSSQTVAKVFIVLGFLLLAGIICLTVSHAMLLIMPTKSRTWQLIASHSSPELLFEDLRDATGSLEGTYCIGGRYLFIPQGTGVMIRPLSQLVWAFGVSQVERGYRERAHTQYYIRCVFEDEQKFDVEGDHWTHIACEKESIGDILQELQTAQASMLIGFSKRLQEEAAFNFKQFCANIRQSFDKRKAMQPETTDNAVIVFGEIEQ